MMAMRSVITINHLSELWLKNYRELFKELLLLLHICIKFIILLIKLVFYNF